VSGWPGFDLHAELIADIERRFWLNVLRTEGCWLWTGGLDSKGYGKFEVAGRTRPASVVSYALTQGPIPPMGLVCHHCDNPPCVRPEHLFLGDHSLNRLDANVKALDPEMQVRDASDLTAARIQQRMDRIRSLNKKVQAKRLDERRARQSATRKERERTNPSQWTPVNFTDEEVRQIRAVPDGRGVDTLLAHRFHVSRQAIAAIRKRQTYRHVSDLPAPDPTRKEASA
jgi:hypothetical protein